MIFWKFLKKFYEKAAEKMVDEIEFFLDGDKKILDLGCGSGILAKKIEERKGVEVFGIDIFDGRLEKIPFKQFDGEKIPFSDNSYDVVLIAFVLHHANNPRTLLLEAKRVSKKIIIFEDIPEKILGKIRCFIHWISWNLFFGKRFIKFNFFSEKEWEKIFRELGFIVLEKKDFSPGFKFIDPAVRKIFVLKK